MPDTFTYLNNGTEKKEEYLPFHPRHNTLQQGYPPRMTGIFQRTADKNILCNFATN